MAFFAFFILHKNIVWIEFFLHSNTNFGFSIQTLTNIGLSATHKYKLQSNLCLENTNFVFAQYKHKNKIQSWINIGFKPTQTHYFHQITITKFSFRISLITPTFASSKQRNGFSMHDFFVLNETLLRLLYPWLELQIHSGEWWYYNRVAGMPYRKSLVPVRHN